MIIFLSHVLAGSMDPLVDEKTIKGVDRSVRIFLSYLDIVDKCRRNWKRGPVWFTSYSYMCCLNIPDVLKKYGSLRNLWEGGFAGEGIIKK